MTASPKIEDSLGAPIAARSDVHERCSATRLLILPANGDAVELNGPAAFVWDLLRAGSTPDEIVRRTAEAYDETPGVVSPLVLTTLAQLHDHGLTMTAE